MTDLICERCLIGFTEKKGLIKHLRRKNVCIPIGSETDPEQLIIKLKQKENGIECKKCNRIYKNNNSLRTHNCKEKSKSKLLDEFREEVKNQKDSIMLISASVQKKDEEYIKLQQNYQTLLTKHTATLKRHQYVKFNDSSPCFYIIENPCNNIQYKFGIAGTEETSTIDERLKSHRTLWPLLKIRYLLFIKDAGLIEKSFKMMYDKEINPNGHEIIEGVSLDDMKKRINKLFDLLCMKDYNIISEEKLKEYNQYAEMTLKSSE
jgi:hypothetical protein